MKQQAYKLSADRFEHKAGTIVYKQRGYDYGLSSDDTRMTGVKHVSVTLNSDGDYPFFTCPVDALEAVSDVPA